MGYIQIPLADLQIGDQIAHIVRIQSVKLAPGKSKPYLQFNIADKSGSFYAKKWGEGPGGATEEERQKYESFKIALVTGTVDEYNGKAYKIKAVSLLAEDVPEQTIKDALGDEPPPPTQEKETQMTRLQEASVQFKTKSEIDFENLVKNQKPLRECEHKTPLKHVLRICSATPSATKQGVNVVDFMLGDMQSQPLKGRLWRTQNLNHEEINKYKVLYVEGEIEFYKDAYQIKFGNDQLVIVTDVTEADVNLLTMSSPYPLRFLVTGIWNIIQTFTDPHLKQLCESLVKDPKNKNFQFAVGGLLRHHSWRSGLIEHTYRLLLLLDDFVKNYNETPMHGCRIRLNRDAILTIGLYHDFYKHQEYTDSGYAQEGNLLKHLSRGIMDIGARTSKIENFPELYKKVLAHGVGAHHGKKEWDTVDTPACPEALVVHWFDNLCSKLDPTLTELNTLKDGLKFSTNRVKQLESIPYLGGCKLGNADTFNAVPLTENYSKEDVEECIRKMINNIKDEHVKALSNRIMDYSLQEFCQNSQDDYRMYKYGLMEYTCRTMLFIGNFVNSYNQKSWPGNNVYLDSDYLIGGALLQSYFQFKKGDSYQEGIGSCLLAIGEVTSQIEGFPSEIRDLMGQIVASQEGENSPEKPICPESITNYYLLHLMHYLDAMNLILSSDSWLEHPEGKTNYVPLFKKVINKGLSLVSSPTPAPRRKIKEQQTA